MVLGIIGLSTWITKSWIDHRHRRFGSPFGATFWSQLKLSTFSVVWHWNPGRSIQPDSARGETDPGEESVALPSCKDNIVAEASSRSNHVFLSWKPMGCPRKYLNVISMAPMAKGQPWASTTEPMCWVDQIKLYEFFGAIWIANEFPSPSKLRKGWWLHLAGESDHWWGAVAVSFELLEWNLQGGKPFNKKQYKHVNPTKNRWSHLGSILEKLPPIFFGGGDNFLERSDESGGHGHGRSASYIAWQFSKHQEAWGNRWWKKPFWKQRFWMGWIYLPPWQMKVYVEIPY